MITRTRRGFLTVELSLALGVMALLLLSVSYLLRKTNEDANVQNERYTALLIENGIKTSFTKILDTFEPICAEISSDAVSSFSWGWQNPSCTSTSPLPVYVADNKIRYDLNLGSIADATEKQSLINAIAEAYGEACRLESTTNNSLTLQCNIRVKALNYQTGAGAVAQYHTPGNTLNYLDVPIVKLTLNREYQTGLKEDMDYNISIAQEFEVRKKYGLAKLFEISTSMKSFYNQKLTAETTNTYPNGLNTIDDAVSPYMWELLGDSKTSVLSGICVRNTATGVCDNINTSAIWRASLGVSPDALVWRRVSQNVLNGEKKYTVDGFGNPLRLVLLANQCTGTNLDSSCTATAPTVPTDNYATLTTLRAPFSTLIYSKVVNGAINCADTSTAAPTTCRFYFAY